MTWDQDLLRSESYDFMTTNTTGTPITNTLGGLWIYGDGDYELARTVVTSQVDVATLQQSFRDLCALVQSLISTIGESQQINMESFEQELARILRCAGS